MDTQLPDHTVGVEEVEERVNLSRRTIWRKGNEYRHRMGGQEPPGRYKVGSRNYRYDLLVHSKWLLNEKSAEPAAKSPIRGEEPTGGGGVDLLTLMRTDLNVQRAILTRLESKVDTLSRAVLALIRDRKEEDATRDHKRPRRS